DHLPESGACPNCGAKGSLTEARQFNLMFKTHVGPVEDEGSVAYLRPETAQGIFVNFANVQTTSRKKPPFGIAQIGKSFRNEITPGNFIFRTREFEQMEMEYFVPPADAERWYEYWCETRFRWYVELGIPESVLRLDPRLAPIKVAVLPLSKKEDLVAVTDRVSGALRRHFMIDVDLSGSIGRRYRRQDEVGTPLCVTVDFDTLDDDAVTVRDRD